MIKCKQNCLVRQLFRWNSGFSFQHVITSAVTFIISVWLSLLSPLLLRFGSAIKQICDKVESSIGLRKFLTEFRMAGLPMLQDKLERFLKLLVKLSFHDLSSFFLLASLLEAFGNPINMVSGFRLSNVSLVSSSYVLWHDSVVLSKHFKTGSIAASAIAVTGIWLCVLDCPQTLP